MELYYIVTMLIILNCIAFYKKKLMVWSSPIVFIIFELVLVFGKMLIDRGSTFKMAFEGEIGMHTARMIPLCIIVSLVASLITVCLRYLRNKENEKKQKSKKSWIYN